LELGLISKKKRSLVETNDQADDEDVFLAELGLNDFFENIDSNDE